MYSYLQLSIRSVIRIGQYVYISCWWFFISSGAVFLA